MNSFKKLLAHIQANSFCVWRFFWSREVWQVVTVDQAEFGCTHIAAACSKNSQVRVFWRHSRYTGRELGSQWKT